MAKEVKPPKEPDEPDLLPAMGLFTILIPMLLSMTAFQKLAIVEITLPERSMMNIVETSKNKKESICSLFYFILVQK